MNLVEVSEETRQQQVSALRNLLECNKDVYAWFLIMADESYESPELVGLFTEVATARLRASVEIEDELRQRGADTDTSVARLLARTWRDTASLFGKDTKDLQHRIASSLGLVKRCCDDYREALTREWGAETCTVIQEQGDALVRLRETLEAMQSEPPADAGPRLTTWRDDVAQSVDLGKRLS